MQFGRKRELDGLALRIVLAGNKVQRLHRAGLFCTLDNPGLPTSENEIPDFRIGDDSNVPLHHSPPFNPPKLPVALLRGRRTRFGPPSARTNGPGGIVTSSVQLGYDHVAARGR